MNRDQMVELWERHTEYEFALKDANLAVSTMVDDAIVMHLPTMSGGLGRKAYGITTPTCSSPAFQPTPPAS
jgi:carboxymethylenebutenolidase